MAIALERCLRLAHVWQWRWTWHRREGFRSCATGACSSSPTRRFFLRPDGSVECGCSTTPAVSEIAILLESLLRGGGAPSPGGLRYTIARALLDVEAPPFDSLDEFSRALMRFERGDRREIVRSLLSRADAVAASGEGGVPTDFVRTASEAEGGPVPTDRRRSLVTAADVRRVLREADRLRYEERVACTCGADTLHRRQWMVAASVLVAAGIGGGVVELAHRDSLLARGAESATVVTHADQARRAVPALAVSDAASERVPGASQSIQTVAASTSKPAAAKTARRPARRHPVHIARKGVASQSPANKAVAPAVQTATPRSEPSALGQFFRFKWLRNAFTQRE